MDLARKSCALLEHSGEARFECPLAGGTSGPRLSSGRSCELSRSFGDALLELFVAALDCRFCLLQRRRLERLPRSSTLCDDKVMRTRRVEKIRGATGGKRVRAQKDHWPRSDQFRQ